MKQLIDVEAVREATAAAASAAVDAPAALAAAVEADLVE